MKQLYSTSRNLTLIKTKDAYHPFVELVFGAVSFNSANEDYFHVVTSRPGLKALIARLLLIDQEMEQLEKDAAAMNQRNDKAAAREEPEMPGICPQCIKGHACTSARPGVLECQDFEKKEGN